MSPKNFIVKYQYLLLFLLIISDQLTKFLVVSQHYPWIPNTGGAWGMGSGLEYYTTVHALLTLVIAYVWWQYRNKIFTNLGFLFIFAGATANLIDRIRVSAVIDFIHPFTWFPWFNLADVYINLGVIIIIIDGLVQLRHGSQPTPETT